MAVMKLWENDLLFGCCKEQCDHLCVNQINMTKDFLASTVWLSMIYQTQVNTDELWVK